MRVQKNQFFFGLGLTRAGESLPDILQSKKLAEIFDVTLDDLINYENDIIGLPVPPKGKHLFGIVTVGDKGQIVIPAKARKVFDINSGDNLVVLGDEEQGIGIIKEKELINRMNIMTNFNTKRL